MVFATTSFYILARKGVSGLMPLSSSSQLGSFHGNLGMRMVATTAADTIHQAQLVQDMLYRVRSINQMPDDVRANLMDFVVDGVKLGKVGCVHFLDG